MLCHTKQAPFYNNATLETIDIMAHVKLTVDMPPLHQNNFEIYKPMLVLYQAVVLRSGCDGYEENVVINCLINTYIVKRCFWFQIKFITEYSKAKHTRIKTILLK
jgi:hypothetical protein